MKKDWKPQSTSWIWGITIFISFWPESAKVIIFPFQIDRNAILINIPFRIMNEICEDDELVLLDMDL